MLIPNSVVKQPWEIIQYTLDMSRLVGANSISELEVKVFTSGGSDVTSSILHASSYSGSTVLVTLKNGTDGQSYNVRVRLTMSDGQQFEEDFTLHVREKNAG